MTVLFIILGVLLTIGGFVCMFTPLLTFMDMGYFFVILVLVYGIAGIIRAISDKRFGVNFVFSIISTVFGICALFFPGLFLVADGIMVYLAAIWFVLMGIVTIVTSVNLTRKVGSKMWIWQLIFGILAIIIGAYSFFHPMVMAISLGLLISIYFVETGITMIASAPSVDK